MLTDDVGLRLQVLRDNDRSAYEALARVTPDLEGRFSGQNNRMALVDLLCQTSVEAPPCAIALIDRLTSLPVELDVMSLRKWAFHGLQRYRNEPAKRLRHFEIDDPLAFADREAERDTEHLLARREELLHYLAGFGFNDLRLEVQEPPTTGTAARSVAIGNDLLLFPRSFGTIVSSMRERLYRAAAAHAAAHLQFSPQARVAGNRQPMLIAVMSLIEDARVERLLAQRYPGVSALWGLFHVATRTSAGFDFAGLAARLTHALHDPDYVDSNAWVMKGRQLFEGAAHDLHDVTAFDKVARLLAIDIEKMRLAFKASAYRVEPIYRDDNSLLWNFNPPATVDETETVVREKFELKPLELNDEQMQNLRRVEVDQRRRTHYPEWDCKLEAVREDWATVIETEPAAELGIKRNSVRPISRAGIRFKGLERIPDRSLRLIRLEEGDELDLNAAVDSMVSRRSRAVPDSRIFRRHGRRRRSTAIVLLMDLSASTERFVPGSFTSVLDVEKRAATLVAESLDASRDRVAVHGFSSNGRQEVNYVCIKDFDEPFGLDQKRRLHRQEGRLSTRMGAALRHASLALGREEADHKVILLLTDGEPSDIDVFEQDYLVEDTRHAVTTATAQGIKTFCLTLDRHADGYVRRIFGMRNYVIADKADAFAGRTGQALVKLIAH
jgi:nitric oxide reductase NorD protein